MLLRIATALLQLALVPGHALQEDAASFIQRQLWAGNSSVYVTAGAHGGAAAMPKPPPSKPKKKKKKSKLVEWKAWLKEQGFERQAAGDAAKPLYVFLVRQFKKRDCKGGKKCKGFGESENRWNIGAIMFCSEVAEGLCKPSKSTFMHTNSLPLIEEYAEEFMSRKFNGDVIFSSHSGISPRHKAVGMEGGGKGVYKNSQFFAEKFLLPLMKNPTVVKRMFFFTCNAGTRFNKKEAYAAIKANGKISDELRTKMNTGMSYIDKLLGHVAKYVDEGMNGGTLPTIYGSNGFTYNGWGMGRSELRVHQLYSDDWDQECVLAAVWMGQGDGKAQKKPCPRLDYTYAVISPAHWSLIEPNIEKFAYPHGKPIDDMPEYPNDAEVAGFLKAHRHITLDDSDDGEGGPRADEDGEVNDVDADSRSTEGGMEDGEDDDDGDEDGDEDEDEDEDESDLLQINAAERVASEPKKKESSNELIRQELRVHMNTTALDSHLALGLTSFSEEEKLRAFSAISRIAHDQNLSSEEKRIQLRQEVVGAIFPKVFSSPSLDVTKMQTKMKKWFNDVMLDPSGSGMKLTCLEEKLKIPLAVFETVMALISVSKCDAKLMCIADTFDVLSSIGSTAASFQYAGAKCINTVMQDKVCVAAVTETFTGFLGIVNTAMAMAHQCNGGNTPEPTQGACGATAVFSGGWALLIMLTLTKIVMEPGDAKGHAMDLIYTVGFFSKMVMETVELCDEKTALCGKEVAEFLAYVGQKGGAMSKAKEYCKIDEMCEIPEAPPGQDPDRQDNDADGLLDAYDPDNDNDGIPNEQDTDVDGDEVKDTKDPDDDNDGLNDAVDQPGMAYWKEVLCNKMNAKKMVMGDMADDIPSFT